MSLHEADLKARLTRILDRKRMPRHLDGKDNAQRDEIAALLAVLQRNAPRGADQLAQWWQHFEPILSERCGAFWPAERDIRDAAKLATKEAPAVAGSPSSGPDMRPVAITARRMQRGEPVGEDWLWGRNAVELATSGLIDADTVGRYRSGAFLSRKSTYGEEYALAWEAEAKDRHEAAKTVWRNRNSATSRRDVAIPDLSAPYDPDSFAA